MIHCIGLNPAIDRVLTVEKLCPGSHAKATLTCVQAAGKAANVARVLSQLGVGNTLHGFIGNDAADFFTNSFANTSVQVRLTRIDQPTRINTTIVDASNSQDTHLRESGFIVSDDVFEAFKQRLSGAVHAGDLVLFCGSLPRGLEPLAVVRLMQTLAGSGVKVGADCNGPLMLALRGVKLALLKPNREELSELLGREISSHDELLQLLSEKEVSASIADMLLVSDGSHGSGIFANNIAAWCAPVEIEVKSTVGAGDALLAGFVAGLERGLGLPEALKYANASAASAVGHMQAGEVSPDEVLSLSGKCTLKTLA